MVVVHFPISFLHPWGKNFNFLFNLYSFIVKFVDFDVYRCLMDLMDKKGPGWGGCPTLFWSSIGLSISVKP